MPSIEDIRTQRKKDKEVLLRMNRACTVLMTSMNISAQELKWERGKSRKTYNNALETLIETIANSYRELEKVKIETQFYKDNLDKAKALEDAKEVSPPELITKDDDEVYLMQCSPEEFTNHMMDKLSDAQQGG